MSDPRNFLNKASGANRWKGYYYYKAGNVLSTTYLSEDKVKAMVKGSENNIYEVILDLDKPTKSKCNCPFAIDRQVLCKHKIAAFYALFPEFVLELENIKNEFEREEDEIERRREEIYKRVVEEVNKMSINQLRQIVINSLYDQEIENMDMSEYDYDHDEYRWWY